MFTSWSYSSPFCYLLCENDAKIAPLNLDWMSNKKKQQENVKLDLVMWCSVENRFLADAQHGLCGFETRFISALEPTFSVRSTSMATLAISFRSIGWMSKEKEMLRNEDDSINEIIWNSHKCICLFLMFHGIILSSHFFSLCHDPI